MPDDRSPDGGPTTHAVLDRRLRIAEQVLWRRIGTEVLILDLDSEEYFGLDGVGGRFWMLIAAGEEPKDAISRLMDHYEVEFEVIAADLASLAEALVDRRLLAVADGQEGAG